MSNQLEKIKELIDRRAAARLGGGEKAIAKQHEKGKYTARERIAMLLDEGSFEEICKTEDSAVKLPVCENIPTGTGLPRPLHFLHRSLVYGSL